MRILDNRIPTLSSCNSKTIKILDFVILQVVDLGIGRFTISLKQFVLLIIEILVAKVGVPSICQLPTGYQSRILVRRLTPR